MTISKKQADFWQRYMIAREIRARVNAAMPAQEGKIEQTEKPKRKFSVA